MVSHLSLLSIMPLSSTRIVANDISFFFYGWIIFHTHIYVHTYIYISHLLYLFICWWKHRLFPYIHTLTVINNGAMNIKVHLFFLSQLVFSFPLDKYLKVELLDHMTVLFLTFWGLPYYFPQWLCQFSHKKQTKSVPFSPQLSNTCYFLSFW